MSGIVSKDRAIQTLRDAKIARAMMDDSFRHEAQRRGWSHLAPMLRGPLLLLFHLSSVAGKNARIPETAASRYEKLDELYVFACEFLDKNPISVGMDFDGEKSKIGELGVTRVHRDSYFQVEFFSLPPHCIVPAHIHPNVDSFEVYVDGQLKFSLGGKFVFNAEKTITSADDPTYRWRMLRIRPTDRHGAVTGDEGARFLSIQRWQNDVPPDTVAADYDGPVMSLAHLERVTTGRPVARRKEDLKEMDAL